MKCDYWSSRLGRNCSNDGFAPPPQYLIEGNICHECFREKVNSRTCYFGDGNCEYPVSPYNFRCDMVFSHCFNGCKGFKGMCDFCSWSAAAYYMPEISTCDAHREIALVWLERKRKRLLLLDSVVNAHDTRSGRA